MVPLKMILGSQKAIATERDIPLNTSKILSLLVCSRLFFPLPIFNSFTTLPLFTTLPSFSSHIFPSDAKCPGQTHGTLQDLNFPCSDWSQFLWPQDSGFFFFFLYTKIILHIAARVSFLQNTLNPSVLLHKKLWGSSLPRKWSSSSFAWHPRPFTIYSSMSSILSPRTWDPSHTQVTVFSEHITAFYATELSFHSISACWTLTHPSKESWILQEIIMSISLVRLTDQD